MSESRRTIGLETRHYRWYPPENHQGLSTQKVELALAQTAMLLVDVYLPDRFDPQKPEEAQNSSLSAVDYQLWRSKITEGIIPAVQAARRTGMAVVYVCNQHADIAIGNSAFGRKLEESLGFKAEDSFKNIFLESTRDRHDVQSGLNFLDGVAPQTGDYFIGKTVYSGFFNTPLDSLLRNLQIKNLICAGFRLDACLLGTMLDALYRNYELVMIRDGVLASELPDEINEQTFTQRMVRHFEALIGKTCTSEAFIRACDG